MSWSCYTCLPVSCNEKKKCTPLCLKCWNFDFSVTCNWKYSIPKWWSAFINNASFELHDKPVTDFHCSYFTDGEREINGVSVKNTHLDKGGCGLESWKSQTPCAFSTILMSLPGIRFWTYLGKEDNPLKSYLTHLLSDLRLFSPTSVTKVLISASCFCFLYSSVMFT